MKFTIRDALWLVLLAGVLFAWWFDRSALYRDKQYVLEQWERAAVQVYDLLQASEGP
jgi:hypothetical protein